MGSVHSNLDFIAKFFEIGHLTDQFQITPQERQQVVLAMSSVMKETAIKTEKIVCYIMACIENALEQIDTFFTPMRKEIEREWFYGMATVISVCVLPSLIDFSDHEVELQKAEALEKIDQINALKTSVAEHLNLETLEGVGLSHQLEINPDRKTIVYFLANNELWQSTLPTLSDLHQHTGCNVTCYNYRGTGKTEGFPTIEAHAINDGVRQVRDLLAKGIEADNIMLYGSSLFGGSIATSVAKKLQQEGFILNVCLERCPRSLSSVIKKTAVIFANELASLPAQFGWNLNPEETLTELRGKVIVIDRAEDCLESTTFIEMNDEEFLRQNSAAAAEINFDPYTRPFSERERTELYTAIKKLC